MPIRLGLLLAFSLIFAGCKSGEEPPIKKSSLIINELVSNNDGVNIDEEGQTEDWLELANISDEIISLKDYFISDGSEEKVALPDIELAPNSVVLFWADDDAKDGPSHLPFKLSSGGETITLYDANNVVVDRVVVPELDVNQSYARFSQLDGFSVCRYASPNRSNGSRCESPSVPVIEDNIAFDSFDLSAWPKISPTTLGLNELALFPASFIELKNFGSGTINLADYALAAVAYGPNSSIPEFGDANILDLPNRDLEPGDVASIDISEAVMRQIKNQLHNEGVVALFEINSEKIIDFAPFMHWPTSEGVDTYSLARQMTTPFSFHFCKDVTPNEQNECEPLLSRQVGNRLRGLYTPSDFSSLAQGSGQANIESVKFVIDLNNNNALHFLGAKDWPLHYTFVREIIENKTVLNRCDVIENREFNIGWYDFSVTNYFSSVTRRFHLGALSKHSNANLSTVEFTFGDEILASQMKDAFFQATALTYSPYDWRLRPQDDIQVLKARDIEGTLPIVSPKAPFKNIVFQGLAPGIAYGTLTYVETAELENTSLGNRVIVVTNDVPNDIDFVGGLVTETFQTPLAHVNILSQSRNTPNMALPNASKKPEFLALMGKLVRLEVTAGGYTLVSADPAEAQAYWDAQIKQTPVLTPRLDTAMVGLIDLVDADFNSLPSIGAKAAQLAEIFKVDVNSSKCSEGADFSYPEGAFAIPMSYYLAHFEKSGAKQYFEGLSADDLFSTNPDYRKLSLATLRQMFFDYPVDQSLMILVEQWVELRYGDERVRFRSSSNTEDLSDFNGAGLYDSLSAELGSSSRPIDVAIKTVWSSLWNLRAYEEREHANVDQSAVAMGILVHAAFTNERANGVGVGRNVLDPTRLDQFYFNSQAGEASVTNPAPGIVTEQLVYQWPTRTPSLIYHSNSSLIDGGVINDGEVRALACALDAVQEHFRTLLDPDGENRWFTVETEFKFLGKKRELLLKQARPYQFGRLDIPNDCREI